MDGCQLGDEPFGAVERKDADGVMGLQAQFDEHLGHFMNPIAVFPGNESNEINQYRK